MKVREGNIGTLFGSFGISLPQIAAQARVKVQPIIGVATNGLPFIAETGDQIECVWAQFVRARDGATTGFTVTPSNPILLTEAANHTWTGNVTTSCSRMPTTTSRSATGAAARTGAPRATSPAARRSRFLTSWGGTTWPVQIDWLNVYDTGAAPA